MEKKRVILHFVLVLAAAFFLSPIVLTVIISLEPLDFVIHGYTLSQPRLAAYAAVLSDSLFVHSFINSIIICAVSVAIAILMSLLAAYGLSRYEFRFKESIFFFLLTTRMGPAAGFAVPFYLMMNALGLIDTQVGLILVYVIIILAFGVWLLRGFMEETPMGLEEAAMVDGYTRWGAIRRVTLPRILSGVYLTMVFCFLFVWNDFFYGVTLTFMRAKIVQIQLSEFTGGLVTPFDHISAAIVIVMIPMIVLFVLLGRRIVRGFALGLVR